jgi:2-amino-4-hydroxy-6-hydroxymethyldihydropteridine diphosphokinase
VGARAVAVALGSNLGDRRANIDAAASELARLLRQLTLSSLIENPAVGEGTEHDPPFLNAACIGLSDLHVRDLVAALLEIERTLGRARPRPNAPRTIDLDLILAGDEIVDDPDAQVPHPRFRDRLFVLEPLAEIAPDMRDPVTGLTVRELLEKQKEPGA